jgi:hypothetical protein
MSGGGYLEPIGAGWSPGPGGLGHPGLASAAGNLTQAVQDGFRSVLGNEQVASGVRSVVDGIRGGTPIVGVGPGFDPALVPEFGSRAGYPRLPGDWDANAWRPASARAMGDPAGARFYGDLGGGRVPGEPGAGGSLIREGLGEIGHGMLSGARSGAIFSGLVSLAVNGYRVLRGREAVSTAAGTVAADTASGAVSGALGAAASGIALAAATAAGLTVGLPLTLVGVAAGLGGALLGNWIFKRVGLYAGIRNAVTRLFGGLSLGNSVGREMPIGSPLGRPLGMPSRVGGMVPVNPNLGRLVPLH